MLNRVSLVIKQKRHYIEDIVLNIFATAIPLLSLQFFLLPKVNSVVGEEEYGLIVTIISVFTFITSTSAGTLNNVRLLMNMTYEEKRVSGDYNIIQLFFSILNAILVIVITIFYSPSLSAFDLILLGVVTILICADGYYSVGFRLQLDYKKILLQKIFLAVGYIIGFFVFMKTKNWIYIYIIGYLLDVAYVLWKTNLLFEPWIITYLFKETAKKETILIVSSLIGGISSYVDKLIIYPIYGGIITSTYYVASLMGKGISMLTFPISGVLLSYFSNRKQFGNNSIKFMTICGWIAGGIGYILCLLVSKPLLSILYPSIVGEAMKYVPVLLVGSVIGVQNTFLSPVVLKFCDTKWQMLISLLNVVGYLGFALLFMKLWGLMGFCIASVATTAMKYFLFIYIYRRDNGSVI